MTSIYKQLFENDFINDKQFAFLESIRTNKMVSLYYELRILLYLGIMLFTAGLGYFTYMNIGHIGHILTMIFISVVIGFGFYFINKFSKPYSNLEVLVEQSYFDYILILVSLLILTLFTYVQVYFSLVELLIHWTTFFSAGILLFMSYRYDNKALLSMGITALAAAVGITISPVNWTKGEWLTTEHLYLTSVLLGVFFLVVAQILNANNIKKHFSFTFQNFGLLLYFVGCISAMFDSNYETLFAIIMLVSAGALSYYTWHKKLFLFFLYSNIAVYISFTYLLFKVIDTFELGFILITYYFPVSCISYVVFLINKKSHFAND